MVSSTSDPDVMSQFLATRSPALREKVVLSYVSLVHYVLGRLGVSPSIGVEYDDLVNQGLMGLIEAVDRYDPSHGTQFSTYATVRVRGKVLDYMRSMDWLSRTARQRTRAVQQAINKLYETSQQVPRDEEVANYLGMDLPKVHQAMVDASHVIVSLDALVDIDEDTQLSLHETLADEDQRDPSDIADENDLKIRLTQVLRDLPEREQLVLSLYYFEQLTLKEIGMVMGVSESRVCQLHARAVMTLKAGLLPAERLPNGAPHGAAHGEGTPPRRDALTRMPAGTPAVPPGRTSEAAFESGRPKAENNPAGSWGTSRAGGDSTAWGSASAGPADRAAAYQASSFPPGDLRHKWDDPDYGSNGTGSKGTGGVMHV
jgi:RNA polymerase sigma factor for flagellar operon FliA